MINMDNNTFYELLKDLNGSKKRKLTFCRPLAANVEFAISWIRQTDAKTDKTSFFGPDRVYLIKKAIDGPYVGLVQDGSHYDLHWYVLPEYRQKGYLSSALRSVILPHLFQDNRDFQCITINRSVMTPENFDASLKLAKTIGFTYTDEKDDIFHYKLSPDSYSRNEYIDGEFPSLTDIRAQEIRDNISHHFKMLEILQSELEIKLGMTDDVIKIKEELDRLHCDFDSIVSEAYENHHIIYVK